MNRWIAAVSLTAALAPTEVAAQPRPATWSVGDVPARVVTPVPAGSVRDEVFWYAVVDDERELRRGLWLAHRADGSVERVPLREAVFAWGREAVVWRVERRARGLRACDGSAPHPTRVDPSACEEEEVTITRLPGGARRSLRRSRCGGVTVGTYTREFSLTGTLGPWLFVDEGTHSEGCGDRNDWRTTQLAYDLRDGAVRVVGASSLGALADGALRSADEELRRRLAVGDRQGLLAPAGSDPVGRVDALSFAVSAEGARLSAVVGVETCATCATDGRRRGWTDLAAPLGPLPDAVRGWTEPPPAWAREFTAEAQTSGWTTFTGPIAVRDAILARVRAR